MTVPGTLAVVLLFALVGCSDGKPKGDPLVIWAERAGGPGWDVARAVAVDESGAIYVAGHFEQQAVFGEGEPGQTQLEVVGGESGGNRDVFLARLEPSGELSWVVGAGGAGADSAHSVAVAEDGSAFLSGVFSDGAIFDAGGPSETSLATDVGNTFLARFTSAGELDWARATAGTWADELGCYHTSAAALGDGSVVIKGTFAEGATFGFGEPAEITLEASGARDDFLARYDGTGGLIWARRLGGEGGAGGVDVLSGGGLVVSGDFEHMAVFGEGDPNEVELTSAGHRDVYLAVIDGGGSLVWAERAGSSGLETTTGVAALADGAFLVFGAFMNQMLFDYQEPTQIELESAGSDTSFVARFDGAGVAQWAIPIGGGGWLDVRSIAALPDGGFAATGLFDDVAPALLGDGTSRETVIESTGGHDVFAAFFDAQGVLVSGCGFGSTGFGSVDDAGFALAGTGDGSAVLVGAFEGESLPLEGVGGAIELITAGRSDAFFALLEP
jgi:hypothetical protein